MEIENYPNVKTLESPLKSLHDEKEYRVIELENGLRALLISDLANLKKENVNSGRTIGDRERNGEHSETCMDLDDEDEEEEEDEGEEEEEEEEGEEEEVEEEEEGDSLNDTEGERTEKRRRKRKTRYLSAASLCIGVGSFEDLLEIQGLMHFLEHMVFMGSEKYPLENCFDNHIKKWGGNDNAHTDYERTNFYFDVQEIHFEKALDMFAQFFISPLMKAEAMKRERKAVHSEFQGALDDDDCRRQQVFSLFANEKHPMSFFTFGNETTLQLEIPDDELHSKLHRLRSQFYSAQYMTLAIQARESLDKLQEMVTQIFSKVPNNGLPKPSYEKFGFPFSQECFHKFVRVIPINDRHTLDINWALPSLQKHYECKPLHYIAFLIGHEGFGSIISYLKKRVWAVDIYAGNDESGFEHNTTYALFNVRLRLTDEGFGHLREIIAIVFQYIRRLQLEGPSERIYSEIQKMEKIDFDYAEEKNTSENVQDLSEEMQLYPPKHYLSGGSLLFQYDPNIITECLSSLEPTNCNIMVSSKKYEHDESITFESEKWFGTKYSIEDIPSQWIQEWQTSEISPSLYLPSPNDFIPQDFSILPSNTQNLPKYPRNLAKNRKGELWYKQDTKFGLPRAYCYIYFSLKYIGESAEMGAMVDLFLNLFLQHIMEPLYPARMAEYETILKAADLGFFMRVSGFNDKLYKCLQMILSQLNDFENCLDDKTFEEMKQQQLKSYHNAILCPDSLRRDSRLVLLQEVHWQVSEKMEALQNVTKEYFLDKFLNRMLSHKYIKMLVQGNVRVQDARMMFKSVVDFKRPTEATNPHDQQMDSTEVTEPIKRKIKTEEEPYPEMDSTEVTEPIQEEPATEKESCPEMRIRRCKNGEWIVRVKSLNFASPNSSVVNYYQGERSTLKTELLNEFIIMAMDEPVFDYLRTKEQLGYHVYCTNRNTYGVLGISVTVNSQANKHSVEHVNERIEAFLKLFYENMKNIPDEEMSALRDTLKNYKLTVDLTLKEEVDRNWDEITCGEYLFSRFEDQIELIPSITRSEVIEYLQRLIFSDNNESYRKLSVQVAGSPRPEDFSVPCHEDTLKKPSEDLVEFLSASEEDLKQGLKKDQFISHLRSFAQQMTYFDAPKKLQISHT